MTAILTVSYWLHLLATVVWLGGLAAMALLAWPALRQETLSSNQWLDMQKRLLPLANASMVVLWISGFFQMTQDVAYSGFLVLDSTWAWALLLKHIAVIGMTALGLFMQLRVYPQMERVKLLKNSEAELTSLATQELRLLRINLGCAAIVLLFTALMTAT